MGIPLISGAVHQWQGQVMFFSHENENAINYRDVVPVAPPAGSIKNCEEEGVAGSTVAWIGSMMATLACRFFVTENALPTEALWIIDSADFQVIPQKMIRRTGNPLRSTDYEFDEENVDYAHLCGLNQDNLMKEITALDLKALMDSGEQFQLIDVREPYEFEEANLGGVLFPLSEVLDHANEIDRDVKVVVHCRAGVRSANAIRALEENFGFTNLINLKGGIIAWANDVDPSLFGG
jgi:adenylyltransferase/sulfurtransferase